MKKMNVLLSENFKCFPGVKKIEFLVDYYFFFFLFCSWQKKREHPAARHRKAKGTLEFSSFSPLVALGYWTRPLLPPVTSRCQAAQKAASGELMERLQGGGAERRKHPSEPEPQKHFCLFFFFFLFFSFSVVVMPTGASRGCVCGGGGSSPLVLSGGVGVASGETGNPPFVI